MGLNIKNAEVEQLASDVASLAHETKTEAIRRALLERHARLKAKSGRPLAKKNLIRYLEQNVWPQTPTSEMGRKLSREEEDKILGFGPDGV